MVKLNKPNFIYCGFPKSGSTWLYKILKNHKEVYVPEVKEIFYFDRYFNKGYNWYNNFYSKLNKEHKIAIDISHDYVFDKQVPRRIYNTLGEDLKIGFILRNPFDYSYSQYLYLKKYGFTDSNFLDTVKKYDYITRTSNYADYLSEYFKYFNTDVIKIWYFNELLEDPCAFAKKIFADLDLSDVDYDYSLVAKKYNKAKAAKYKHLSKFIKFGAQTSRNLGLYKLITFLKDTEILHFLYKEADNHKMTIDDYMFLKPKYIEYIENLELLLDKDLNDWKTFDY